MIESIEEERVVVATEKETLSKFLKKKVKFWSSLLN